MTENLIPYVEAGRMAKRSTTKNGIGYDLYCYTKEQFFNCEWDETTIAHRGTIYREDGKQINHPFLKIFNLNESPSTDYYKVSDLMFRNKYEVLDKVNGHLVIVSYDPDYDNLFVTTKGSFDGELAQQDALLVNTLGIERLIRQCKTKITFMFECLADYDKHLFFEEQQKSYNQTENILVLLGAIDEDGKSLHYTDLLSWGFTFNVPVTHCYSELENWDNLDLNSLFDHKNREGYVFHFPMLNFRFKIKTSQYITLRYMKEITTEKLVNKLYNSGIDNLYKDYDEEMYPIIQALEQDLRFFFTSECINAARVVVDHLFYKQGKLDKKSVFTDDSLNHFEQCIITDVATIETMAFGKKVCGLFKERGTYTKTEAKIKEMFDQKIVDTMDVTC